MSDYYGVAPSNDFFMHYGIRGMKWGVRKAIERGDQRAYSRQYRKAQRKLARLQKQATSGAKYARRAAALGIGAAGVTGYGHLATGLGAVQKAGQSAVSRIKNVGEGTTDKFLYGVNPVTSAHERAQGNITGLTQSTVAINDKNGHQIASITRKNTGNIPEHIQENAQDALSKLRNRSKTSTAAKKAAEEEAAKRAANIKLGSTALGLGLAGAAGYNAYRALTTKRAARKAEEFKREMNRTFRNGERMPGQQKMHKQKWRR